MGYKPSCQARNPASDHQKEVKAVSRGVTRPRELKEGRRE